MKKMTLKNIRSSRLRPHILPIFVWLLALGAVVVLYRHRVQRFEVLGLAQGQVHQIAATSHGRLKDVPVRLFEQVRHDQTVAIIDTILDNENIQTQLNTASAEVQRLRAEVLSTKDTLLAEGANLEADRVAAQRRFSVDVDNARLRILELKTLLEIDGITLEDLALEVKIVQGLLDQDAVAPLQLQKAQVQYNVLERTIQENQKLLAQAEEHLQQARRRRDEFAQQPIQHPSVEYALDPIRKGIEVQEQLIEELLARRVPVLLKAPFAGLVNQIMRKTGETVLRGETILTIAQTIPTEIIAYADDNQASRVKEGMTVKIIKRSQPLRIASSQVVHLGPDMQLMPERLWQNPNIPQWGRPILIAVDPKLKLIPGELVGIKGI